MIGRLKRTVVDALPEPTLRRVGRALHREPVSLAAPAARPASAHPLPVTTFDAHDLRRRSTADVVAALAAAGVDTVRVPGRHGQVRQVGVAAEQRERALTTLETLVTEPGWTLTPSGRRRRSGRVLRAGRSLVAPDGRAVPADDVRVEVGFWVRGADGSRTAPSDNQVTEQLSAAAWDAAVRSERGWPGHAAPDVFELREPVDLVYTWVDGDDPRWRANRAAHEPADGEHNVSAVHEARFLSRDELRYSLRSVAMYAGWVRRIHIVTDAQVPPWLDVDHPKISVVDHRDIFTDPSVLPVFNSHAIECQLHHIDGLAEHYLYLNDDMFFGRAVEPELFFHGNGVAAFFLGKGTIDLDPASPDDLPVVSAAKNQRELLLRDFGVLTHRKFKHVGHPQHRTMLQELEQRYPELFARVAASRFRHPGDISVPSSLVHYYAYERGRAVPGEIGYRYQDIGLPDTGRRLDEIRRQRPEMFCLNDITSEAAQWAEQARTLQAFFDECFPLPCAFERP